MDFSDALQLAKAGHRITRHDWTDGQQVMRMVGTDSGATRIDRSLMLHADGRLTPWTPDQADLFAADWAEA